MKANDAKRLKELERENAQLKADRGGSGARGSGVEGDLPGKLVGPARRRQAVAMLRDPPRCQRALGMPSGGHARSTQRREPERAADDAALRAELRKFSADRPRWGYRRAHHELLEQGWVINRKRVQRLWREEGLRVPQRRRKRRRLGDSTVPAARLRAERPNQVWAFDFQFDQTVDGKVIKLLNVVDEVTRESLEMLIERGIDADQTVSVLERPPEYLRCDNGPEMTAHALRDWCTLSS